MLKRNMDRENKLDAKKYAQRNASSFAFGSSTPRSLNLDMVALGPNRLSSITLLAATPKTPQNQTYNNNDIDNGRRRPVSAFYPNERIGKFSNILLYLGKKSFNSILFKVTKTKNRCN